MRLTDISFNDLRRRKSKMALLVVGLVIGVSTIVSLVSITQAMQADVREKLDRFGSNVVVAPKSDAITLSYGGVSVASASVNIKDLKADDLTRIEAVGAKYGATSIAPKLVGGVRVGDAKALLVGVDLPAELRANRWWEITGREPKGPGEVMLGALASRKFSAMPGGKLTLSGLEFAVTGVLREMGSQEDSVIFADLARAQQILGKPSALTIVEVSAPSSRLDSLIGELTSVLPDANVTALSSAMESRQQRVGQLTSFALAVSIVVLVVGVVTVLTTMMSAVSERRREIGIFRATGFRKTHVAIIILFEAFVVSVIGGIAGWLLGSLFTLALGARLAQISTAIGPSPVLGATAIVVSVLIGMAGAAYPALRAANLDPADALRFT
ncbi:MAG: ABC transporter permease [Chloroflexi bacterium]|nr:ABC transporter permease [Chloroflexota bacterium]